MIIILGILAAIVPPRFVNLQSDARIAKLEAARAKRMAAASLAHATVLARGGLLMRLFARRIAESGG